MTASGSQHGPGAGGHVDHLGAWHEASLRICESYDVVVPATWRIDLDVQPYTEVVLVLAGVLGVDLGAEHATVGPGGLAVLRPGPRRSTRAIGTPVRFAGFGFRAVLPGSRDLGAYLRLPLHLRHPPEHVVRGLRLAVAHGASGGPLGAIRARATAELTVADLVEAVGAIRMPDARPAAIDAALELVHGDPNAVHDVGSLARRANLSTKHFSRRFRDEVGVPPMTYVYTLRLRRARADLTTTDRTVADIAAANGFADAAHLSRAFKQHYRCTPTQYRRAVATAPDPSGRPAPAAGDDAGDDAGAPTFSNAAGRHKPGPDRPSHPGGHPGTEDPWTSRQNS